MKLLKYNKLTGKIKLQTGLHIGGSADTTKIGGADNPVIRQPIDDRPYIPGSSIKGKLRSLLEMKMDKLEKDGKMHKYRADKCPENQCKICRIFGTMAQDQKVEEQRPIIGPGRLVVRDALVHNDSSRDLDTLQDKGLPYAEDKPEISLNRITAAPHLRTMERVPAGISFDLDISFRIFDIDGDNGKSDEQLFELVKEGLALIQSDCLGGSGSRGYGKVEFVDLQLNGEHISLPEV